PAADIQAHKRTGGAFQGCHFVAALRSSWRFAPGSWLGTGRRKCRALSSSMPQGIITEGRLDCQRPSLQASVAARRGRRTPSVVRRFFWGVLCGCSSHAHLYDGARATKVTPDLDAVRRRVSTYGTTEQEACQCSIVVQHGSGSRQAQTC